MTLRLAGAQGSCGYHEFYGLVIDDKRKIRKDRVAASPATSIHWGYGQGCNMCYEGMDPVE